MVKDLKSIQRTLTPADKLPSETQVKLEISYNKMQIFKNSEMLYFLIGTFLLILYYIKLLARPKKEKIFKVIRGIFVVSMIVTFLYHGYGLAIRSYISGHAPWSDGYEALVFIAWVAVLLGLIFMKRIPVILALAALLAGSIIMVTQLELLDPQITPLAPVLKSYWLKVHVAVITSSYAFLGLSCILGLTNLVLLAFRNMRNAKELNKDINDLTHASEILMMIGTFMLTIGTFLGGIWANESWGRYWGWDPKETWALASVLVYAIILHFRFIPGLKSKYAFNVASFFGYAAILFTFFGVNFILVGLHSYAQGDGSVSLPVYIWYMLALFIVLAVIAGVKGNRYNRKMKELL
jgi:cytochrome c-type biogenesis protein CcsB